MGQRFQVAYITKCKGYGENEGKELIEKQDFHLQWCWGYYSIIRAHQILNHFEEELNDDYSIARSDYRKDELDDVFHCLLSVNNLFHSYVRSSKYDEDGGFTENPFDYDNNDGIFLVDLRGSKPKYCFGYFSYDSDWNGIEITNATGYMKHYEYLTEGRDFDKMSKESRKELIEMDIKIRVMVNEIDTFELMTKEEVCQMYDELDIKDLRYSDEIDKENEDE